LIKLESSSRDARRAFITNADLLGIFSLSLVMLRIIEPCFDDYYDESIYDGDGIETTSLFLFPSYGSTTASISFYLLRFQRLSKYLNAPSLQRLDLTIAIQMLPKKHLTPTQSQAASSEAMTFLICSSLVSSIPMMMELINPGIDGINCTPRG
jgi:hypothetical protein